MNQDQIISRQKTIILQASEKQSLLEESKLARPSSVFNKVNGTYSTILSKPVNIENGDVVSLQSCYIDATNIDPDQIVLEEDVDVSWTNGLYLRNQQLETFQALYTGVAGDTLTDNKLYPLCSYTIAGSSTDVVKWTTCTVRSEVDIIIENSWGGLHYQVQYQDENGNLQRKMCYCPVFGGVPIGKSDSGTMALDFVGLASYTPRVVDPVDGKVMDPGAPFVPDPRKGGSDYENIRKPCDDPLNVPAENGRIQPVLLKSHFTLKAGSYAPDHLAKVINDGLVSLPQTRLRQPVVETIAPFPIALQPVGDVPPNTTGTPFVPFSIDFCVPAIDEYPNLTYPYVLVNGFPPQEYIGWNMRITFPTLDPVPPSTTPLTNARFVTTTVIIQAVGDGDTTFPNRWWYGELDATGTIVKTQLPFAIATTGPLVTPEIFLSPPDGEFSGGSSFLQTTENYMRTAPDGCHTYCFCDPSVQTTAAEQIVVFSLDLANAQFIGTNQMELVYDPDIKRFKFGQIHTAPTGESDTTPALIAQTTSVSLTNPSAPPAFIFGRARDDAGGGDKVRDTFVSSIGGVYFTDLQPLDLWRDKLGFVLTGDNSVLVHIETNETSKDRDYQGAPLLQHQVPPANQFATAPEPYISCETPFFVTPLQEGVNVTGERVSIADVTGVATNYTTEISFSNDALPSNNGGRVVISANSGIPIIAPNSGSQVGVQDSGYYLVDIALGLQYNEQIGGGAIGSTYSKHIRMIVDRYYSANSYVSGQQDGVSYIHYGNPTTISSIDIRIYNSDGTEIDRLGNDNTIFLKILKNIQIDLGPPQKK